jgi:hypothetical protein
MSLYKKYLDNLKRALPILGGVLLAAVLLGLAAELWLRGAKAGPEVGAIDLTSPAATFALALASVIVAFPVIGAVVVVPLLASHLLHHMYALSDLNEAHNTLNRIVFGHIGTGLAVKGGKVDAGADHPVVRVGGPAGLAIQNDSAVVTEQYGRLKRVLGPGGSQLERFEKVWEAVDLRPQRWVHEVFALTKEGIPISCEVDISFKVDDRPDGPGHEAHAEEPYAYTEEAVFRAAASVWIRDIAGEGRYRRWPGRVVVGTADGLLRNILAEYRLDWLIAPAQPGQPHPREEIRQRLEEGLEESVGGVGARVLQVSIGAIAVKSGDAETTRQLSDMVSKQWIEAWHADWKVRALASRAEGEAELLRLNTAQIQAQTEMVVTLVEAIQATMVNRGAIEPYIMALRFVEALRWMSYNAHTREFMPPEAMRTLKKLQELLGAEVETPGGQERKGQS